MAKNYNYDVGSEHEAPTGLKGTIRKKRCYQCRKTSVLVTKKTEECLNNCGPERLMKLFQI